jgi:serine/threonine protein kinase
MGACYKGCCSRRRDVETRQLRIVTAQCYKGVALAGETRKTLTTRMLACGLTLKTRMLDCACHMVVAHTYESRMRTCNTCMHASIAQHVLIFHTQTLPRSFLLPPPPPPLPAPQDSIPSDCRDLLEKLLVKDFTQRIKLEEIKAHPWLNS